MTKLSPKFFSEHGKKGAPKRWPKRYSIIEELRKYTTKEQLDIKISRWSTEQLEVLLGAYKNK